MLRVMASHVIVAIYMPCTLGCACKRSFVCNASHLAVSYMLLRLQRKYARAQMVPMPKEESLWPHVADMLMQRSLKARHSTEF